MPKQSLLDLKHLTPENVLGLFALADRLSGEKPPEREHFKNRRGLTAALVFFEPSTRTRMSFESACLREGLSPILLDCGSGTSLEKGETLEDTVLNVAAMDPALMIIRTGDGLDLEEMSRRLPIPILNGGWGKRGHPTQALLDAYAIHRRKRDLRGQRVLLIGDIRHSRVAASHFELARILGYDVALCGPPSFLPEKSEWKVFDRLEDGLKWATVAMALRVQLERHEEISELGGFHTTWGLNPSSLEALSADGLVMHPGPVNWGVEMSEDVTKDPRCLILDQVRGGVWIRQALIRQALEAR